MTENCEKVNNKEVRRLSLQLKSTCNNEGVEIDSVKSAEIIHKLGLVYFQQDSNKTSLIQSVGLLNSAIARNPKNILTIKQDLLKICQFVLQQAKAQHPNIDLIQKANQVKEKIKLVREKVNKKLTFLETIQNLEKLNGAKLITQQKSKIKLIKNIQLQTTNLYKNIMKDLSQFCEHVMGPTPCKFAVIGMGSLARNEITPYSDFEHIILLENSSSSDANCLEYFRWFSVIFHVIVLNLQETIIPSLNIEYLNDKTGELGDWFFDTCTSGISFDDMMVHACKFPLGRTQPTKNKPWTTELIKPVDKMLEYLSDDVNLKNGYHLSDILTKTCFIYGNEALHNAFETGIKSYKRSKTPNELLDQIKKQVKDDLNNFATRTKLVNLKPTDKLNVKQMFYRTSTLFITALGKLCGTKSSSCFEIIDELAEQRKISENTKHKLSYAVAIACEVRLCVYMKAQSQRDYIQPHEKSETIFDEILKFIDKDSILNYFQITYCLQREIITILEIKGSHIYSNFTFMNITICYALRLDVLMLTLMEEELIFFDVTNLNSGFENIAENVNIFRNFDKYLADMENELDNCARKISDNPPGIICIADALSDIAYDDSNGYLDLEEQTELVMRIVEIVRRLSFNYEDRKKISETLEMDIDSCIGLVNMIISALLIAMNRYDEASTQMNQAFEAFVDQANNKPEDVTRFYFTAGDNWLALKNYEKSLNCWQIALGICLSVDLVQFNFDIHDLAMMYSGIGICLLKLDQYEESLIYLNFSIITMKDNVDDYTKAFINPALTFHSLGKVLMQLELIEDAVRCFFETLEITENQVLIAEKQYDFLTLFNKGIFREAKSENSSKHFL